MSPSIAPQDPSTSPTYAMSTHQPSQMAAGSIRRNLFAGHLSRRPTTTATSSQNPFGSPLPPNEEHVQASLSSIASSIPAAKRNVGFNEIYDHDASPPPPSSTSTLQSTNLARENIVAVHPVTGRPLLPNIPSLPPRLRLTDGEREEEEMSDVENEQHQSNHTAGFTRSPSYHSGLNHLAADFDLDQDMDLDSSELERFNTYQSHSSLSMRHDIHQFLDTASDESRADGERIEYLLLEMASRQRARARTIPIPSSNNTTSLDPGTGAETRGLTTSTASQAAGTSALSSSRRRAGAAGSTFTTGTTMKHPRRDPSPPKPDAHPHLLHAQSGIDTSTLPVGKAIDPLEKEELVSLILTSLRRKVALAEEEGWMYGDRDYVGIGIGLGGTDGEPFD